MDGLKHTKSDFVGMTVIPLVVSFSFSDEWKWQLPTANEGEVLPSNCWVFPKWRLS